MQQQKQENARASACFCRKIQGRLNFPSQWGADLPDTFHTVSPLGTMLMVYILKNNKINKNGRKTCKWSASSDVTPLYFKGMTGPH